MNESFRRNEVIVSNKTSVDTRDFDSDYWRLWPRELAVSSLMEWLKMLTIVAVVS